MFLKWFASKTVRQAEEMRKHVQKLLDAQRDILSPPAVAAVQTALDKIREAVRDSTGDEAVQKQIANLEEAANKWLKPYPNAGIRENVEVLLVALAVAMGIRTFVLQPFKIPTGSMQPTLYGVTPSLGDPDFGHRPDLQIPGALTRFYEYWVHGVSYINVVAPDNGTLMAIEAPAKFLMFNLKQRYEFNHQWYTVWFPPDEMFGKAGYGNGAGRLINGPNFTAGQPIVRLRLVAGDHLFVDRVTYNFRHPKRGEIIVFETKDVGRENYRLPPDQFFIKRLVAMGGERVQIGQDRHLIIDGKRLDKTTPHFENVYSFDPGTPAEINHYSGHVEDARLAPWFMEQPDNSVTVRPEHFIVMGDNTMNSLDSRTWGDFSRTNVIGKYFFVYWPFSSRFGWSLK